MLVTTPTWVELKKSNLPWQIALFVFGFPQSGLKILFT
jgi:hypothetical protein